MKKIIFITIPIILILLSIIIVAMFNHNKTQSQTELENIKATTETFSIGDNGTEIDVLLKNENKKDVTINIIEANLYNTQNKKIKTIKYSKQTTVKGQKDVVIKIKSKGKFSETSQIKYKIIK